MFALLAFCVRRIESDVLPFSRLKMSMPAETVTRPASE